MKTRRPLVIGNWKMNTTLDEAVGLARAVVANPVSESHVVICPPFPWLPAVRQALAGSDVSLGAQNCSTELSGAWTGEVSAVMLAEVCDFVIVGHSERRTKLGETDVTVATKTTRVLETRLRPVICVGEDLAIRTEGSAVAFVSAQLDAAVAMRSADDVARLVIAYEPIWAIGTGISATADDAGEMAAAIRSRMTSLHGEIGHAPPILYGGSVTPATSERLFTSGVIDGALVGGASLKASDFLAIARSVRV